MLRTGFGALVEVVPVWPAVPDKGAAGEGD